MSKELLLIALALASATGTVWLYWGVPRRAVTNWAMGMGAGFAIISAILWAFFAGALGTPPASRIVGGIALGLGIATGGVVARVLYRFGCPARQDGA